METSLQSLSKIFTEKIFRIPDYQRGYAWTEKQLKDFWTDLCQLEKGKNHYVGVLTVEEVPKETYENWSDDFWIIEDKSYTPLYIVDGQQRLTTSIILIETITEFIPEGKKLNHNTANEIRKKFIFDSKDDGISRSYIFGYEKDNPSYDFLKCKIFGEELDEFSLNTETIYTNNLEHAKIFFREELKQLSFEEIELFYKKLTQDFLFNSYSISTEIDVFIAFETMNNRGKPLSYLELLKNRLIYLSTKFDTTDNEKQKLRKRINECWKSIYHNLGRNKFEPLDDDQFLHNHFILYFSKNIYESQPEKFKQEVPYKHFIRGRRRFNYSTFLLEDHFVTKNIKSGSDVTLQSLYTYVNSLQNSVEAWYEIFNPNASIDFSDKEQFWLEKINRIRVSPVAALILVFFRKEKQEAKRVKLLKILEKYLFMTTVVNYRYHFSVFHDNFMELASDLFHGSISIEKVLSSSAEMTSTIYSSDELNKDIKKSFRSNGFYRWEGIRYFMYEYDLALYEKSKTKRIKLDWKEFSNFDYSTVEHIYPQNPRKDCWKIPFKNYTSREKSIIRNSLGNLLPLSQPKNSSFQNKCFKDKVSNDLNTVGFRFGCYSENEVTKQDAWTPIQILERGLKLLDFMEKRWGVKLGDIDEKIEFLNLSFVLKKEGIKSNEINTANTVYSK